MGQGRSKVIADSRAKRKQQATQLLFLGAGESGKSTIVKQAVLNYGSGYSQAERLQYRKKIKSSLVLGACAVFQGAEKLNIKIESKATIDAGNRLLQLSRPGLTNQSKSKTPDHLTDELVADLRVLWEDPGIKEAISQSHRFQLEDTWTNFMCRLERYPEHWGGADWIPDDTDILEARTMTSGYNHVEVTLGTNVFSFIDVGGQRTERKKWINVFQSIDAVVFVTSLSEYNQKLFEDETVSRLEESLSIFKQYGRMEEFKESAFLLFFNKYDLLIEKFFNQNIPLPKIEGLPDPPLKDESDPDCMKALEWFKTIFSMQLKDSYREANDVYLNVTTALDKGNVRFVLTSCKEFVLQKQLRLNGMLPAPSTLRFMRET